MEELESPIGFIYIFLWTTTYMISKMEIQFPELHIIENHCYIKIFSLLHKFFEPKYVIWDLLRPYIFFFSKCSDVVHRR